LPCSCWGATIACDRYGADAEWRSSKQKAGVGLVAFVAEHPHENWPEISFWVGLAVDVGIFFTPLLDGLITRPSRGGIYRLVRKAERGGKG